jgi:hypothetical protein
MIAAIPMTTLLSVDPALARKAERLQFAMDLLRRHHSELDVRRRVQQCYRVSRATAWRTVDAAKDLA